MNIKHQKVQQLIPYVNNARTHSDDQVSQIAASIREFGFNNPVLVDGENNIIAGHGRLMAARVLDMDKVPTICLDHLTESQKKAYILADNKLALNAGWDMDLLKLELGDLFEDEFDLSLIGFSDDELADLLNDPNEGLTDEDAVPEAPEDPLTVLGDVWVLGNHRLVCGDATSVEAVDKCLNGVKPHLMVTDPPYGVEYDPSWRNRAGTNTNDKKQGKVLNDDKADWTEAWALFPGDVAYVWHAGLHAKEVQRSLEDCKFNVRSQIIWAKDRFALSRGDYHWQHEPCWYAVRENKKGSWKGDRKQSTIWNINAREDGGHGHGTQKPVECMKRPIENNSSPGQAVYEPFSGSGTTIIAAEKTGRHCLAIELEPKYVDIAIIRWQDFTGQDAILESTGKSYSEVLDGTKAS